MCGTPEQAISDHKIQSVCQQGSGKFKICPRKDLKELVPFTQLVKVRRGKLVLALPNIRFSGNFYQIISGTKYEKKTSLGPIPCYSNKN